MKYVASVLFKIVSSEIGQLAFNGTNYFFSKFKDFVEKNCKTRDLTI